MSADEVALRMKTFYGNPRHSIDMQDAGNKDYLNWAIDKFKSKAIENPIKYINKRSAYFNYDEINKELYISDKIIKFNSPLFVKQVEDILEYKLRDKCAKLYKKQEE